MAMSRRIVGVMLLIIALCATFAMAQGVDASSPKGALKSLYTAIEKADQPAIIQLLLVPDDPQQELAKAYASMLVAAKRFGDVARQKFPGVANSLAQAALAPEEVVARLPVAPANPDAAAMVDLMLRLLASYDVVRCRMEEGKDGRYSRWYSAAPVCKWLTPNEDGVSMAALALMNQDKVLMESW